MGFEAISSTIFAFSQLSPKKAPARLGNLHLDLDPARVPRTRAATRRWYPPVSCDEKGRLCKADFLRLGVFCQKKRRMRKKKNAQEKNMGIFKNYSHFLGPIFLSIRSKNIHVVQRTHVPSLKKVLCRYQYQSRKVENKMIYGWLSFRSLIKKKKHEKARSQRWSKRNLLAESSAYNLPKKQRVTTVLAHNMRAGGVPRMRISWVTSQGRKIQYRNTSKPLIGPLLRAFHKLAFFVFPVPTLQNKCCMRVTDPKKISGEANVCWLWDSTYWLVGGFNPFEKY